MGVGSEYPTFWTSFAEFCSAKKGKGHFQIVKVFLNIQNDRHFEFAWILRTRCEIVIMVDIIYRIW